MKRRDFIVGSLLTGLCIAAGIPVCAASPASFTQQQFVSSNGEVLSYWLYTPENASKDMPLIVYLHGGSGKGSDLSLLLQADSLPKFLQSGQAAPAAYVVMPQLPKACTGWADKAELLLALIDSIVNQYALDAGRVSLTGHSMGGTGTWAVAQKYPERFSAIAPLSGSIAGTPDALRSLKDLPVWAVVGAKDTIVPPESSRKFINALSRTNPDCHCTVLPDADHFAVPTVYLDEKSDLLGWLTVRKR